MTLKVFTSVYVHSFVFMCVKFPVKPTLTTLFSVSVVLSFCECYINGMKQFVTFSQDTLKKKLFLKFILHVLIFLLCPSSSSLAAGSEATSSLLRCRPLIAVASCCRL